MTLAAQLWRHGTGRIGLVLVVLLLAVTVAAGWLAPADPNHIDVLHRFQAPSPAHWFGTDQLGRDFLSRLVYGTRLAVGIAVSVAALSLAAGTALGIAAAYAPPWGERALLVAFDVLSAFPSLIFALALVAVLGPGLANVMIVVALSLVPQFGRVARAQVLALRQAPFLEAERALGAGPLRVALVHILPNILGSLAVLASMDVPAVITIEAALSFLGVGVAPPLASWGTLLHDGYDGIDRSYWPVGFAGGALIVATLGFTLLGEALRDVIDPKLRPPV